MGLANLKILLCNFNNAMPSNIGAVKLYFDYMQDFRRPFVSDISW